MEFSPSPGSTLIMRSEMETMLSACSSKNPFVYKCTHRQDSDMLPLKKEVELSRPGL